MAAIFFVVVIGTSIWVAVDASNIGYPRGGKAVLDMGPVGWFFACLLLWIVAFPCYLVKRGELIRQAEAARAGNAHDASVVPGTPGGPPHGYWQASDGNWYPPSTPPPAMPPAPAGDTPPGPGYWKAADGHWYPPTITPPAPSMPTNPHRPAGM